MIMRVLLMAVVVAMASAAVAERQKPQADPKIVTANTGFGFGLFQLLAKDTGGKRNVVISPASLSLALAMTYNGADGTTGDAMAKALGYSGMSLEAVNAGNKALVAKLQQPADGVELSVANSLWARKDLQFRPGFLQRSKDFYQAMVTALDFANPDAPDKINAWVKEKTRGKIESIVGAIYPSDILYLINAVYFKGLWSAPFDENLTRDGDFTTADGRMNKVPMMHRTGRYEYMEGSTMQAVGLPYGEGRMSMYIVLPAKGVDPMSLWEGATPEAVEQQMKLMRGRSRKVELTLPKFKSEIKLDREMKTALSALGMATAFDPEQADFHAMVNIPPTPNVYIGQVVHKTFIEVNEKGTEAAAATSVGMAAASAPAPEPPPVVMKVDRPFFLSIWDTEAGELLFLGLIADPRPPVMIKKPGN